MATNGADGITWEDAEFNWNDSSFTWDDVETKKDALIAEWTANEYARNRASEYPALAEQLDEIFHNGIDSWKAVIKVTKDKYPK